MESSPKLTRFRERKKKGRYRNRRMWHRAETLEDQPSPRAGSRSPDPLLHDSSSYLQHHPPSSTPEINTTKKKELSQTPSRRVFSKAKGEGIETNTFNLRSNVASRERRRLTRSETVERKRQDMWDGIQMCEEIRAVSWHDWQCFSEKCPGGMHLILKYLGSGDGRIGLDDLKWLFPWPSRWRWSRDPVRVQAQEYGWNVGLGAFLIGSDDPLWAQEDTGLDLDLELGQL